MVEEFILLGFPGNQCLPITLFLLFSVTYILTVLLKAFCRCTAHLTVVILWYDSTIFLYIRNTEVKKALRKALGGHDNALN
ncbi:olfactory receptor 287-like [Ciconia maguari]